MTTTADKPRAGDRPSLVVNNNGHRHVSVGLLAVGGAFVWLSLLLGLVVLLRRDDDENASSSFGKINAAARIIDIASKSAKHLDNLNKKRKHDSVPSGCETTLLIIRHCEKHGPHQTDHKGDEHCSYLGQERIDFQHRLFGNVVVNSTTARWPLPSQLYALKTDRAGHYNFRELDTIEPLANKTGLPIIQVGKKDFAKPYFKMLQSGALCGKLTLVCWKHARIPKLATALGCGPYQGCPLDYPQMSFDEVWQLKYVYNNPSSRMQQAAEDAFHPRPTGRHRRSLRKKARRHGKRHSKKDGWSVFATVQHQNFDPLAFRQQQGGVYNVQDEPRTTAKNN